MTVPELCQRALDAFNAWAKLAQHAPATDVVITYGAQGFRCGALVGDKIIQVTLPTSLPAEALRGFIRGELDAVKAFADAARASLAKVDALIAEMRGEP